MNKTEAIAVNVLLRACGVRIDDHTAAASQDAVVVAVHVLAKQAHKAISAGVSTSHIDAWRGRDAIVPSRDLFGALEELRKLDPHVWFDQATAFSCIEADTLHELLGAIEREDTAAEFMAAHVDGDMDEDYHKLDHEVSP